jgi:hypothetical protein
MTPPSGSMPEQRVGRALVEPVRADARGAAGVVDVVPDASCERTIRLAISCIRSVLTASVVGVSVIWSPFSSTWFSIQVNTSASESSDSAP